MIPEDLWVEILLRLPVKSLARCLCVSKLWSSIIRNRRFINLYQSTCHPRVMFAFRDICRSLYWQFFSSSQPPYLGTNAAWYIDSSVFRNPECVNGLICVEYMYRLWICNPVVGKAILLPPPSTRKPFTTWFMGYDPINYQYKVLYLSKDYLSGRCTVEVFTLLGDQVSWKMIERGNFQAPVTRGICVDGFLYYGAFTTHGPRFVKFNVRTETFGNSIKIPAEARNIFFGSYLGFYTLVNYQGKITLLATKTIRRYDLWVLEDAEKQEWSRVSHVITRDMCSFDLVWPGLVGFVAGSGELIVTACDRYDQFYLFYIDLEKKCSRKVCLEGIRCSYRSPLVLAFTDYVESIMLL